MAVCFVFGVGVAGFLLWRMLSGPREAVIVNSCIVYRTGQDHPVLIGLAYLAATSLPLIASSQRAILALGVVVLAGCLVAYIFYWQAFLSVWCFFAAAASITILAHFEWARRQAPLTAAYQSFSGRRRLTWPILRPGRASALP